VKIRKLISVVEETRMEGGKDIVPPTRKAIAAAVVTNPLAGGYYDDLTQLFELGEELGSLLGKKAVQALGIAPQDVESYGKAAIVGERGELEHAAAVLHPKLGNTFRKEVGGGKAIIPSTKKIGGTGTAIDIPLFYKNAAFVVSHIDAVELRISDAPKADEIVVALAVTDSGRPIPRSGGLRREEAKGEDGLR
jgi:hypothetical protein